MLAQSCLLVGLTLYEIRNHGAELSVRRIEGHQLPSACLSAVPNIPGVSRDRDQRRQQISVCRMLPVRSLQRRHRVCWRACGVQRYRINVGIARIVEASSWDRYNRSDPLPPGGSQAMPNARYRPTGKYLPTSMKSAARSSPETQGSPSPATAMSRCRPWAVWCCNRRRGPALSAALAEAAADRDGPLAPARDPVRRDVRLRADRPPLAEMVIDEGVQEELLPGGPPKDQMLLTTAPNTYRLRSPL